VVGLRDQANQKATITGGVIVGVIVILVGIIILQLRANHESTASGDKMFYSSDDGRTWFADAVEKIPPFDHEGEPAVRCYVFKTSSSAPFVGYMETYTQALHDQLAGLTKSPAPIDPWSATLVKRPGDANWVLEMSPPGQRIVNVRAPGGSAEQPQPVLP
jgi:hypothetical protein